MEIKKILRFLINLLFLAAVALGLMYLLTYRQFLNRATETYDFIEQRTKVFYYCALIIYVWLLFLTAIFRRVNRSIGITFICIVVITYINACKFRVRGTPLLPEDFQLAGEVGSLFDFIDVYELLRLVLAVSLIVVLSIILGKMINKAKLELFPKNSSKEVGRLERLILLGASLLMLGGLTGFVLHRAGTKYENIDFLNTTFTAWNQARNYEENGFLLGFLYNLAKLDINMPDEYSKETIVSIRDEFQGGKTDYVDNVESTEKPSVVIILNESFIDPETIRYFYDYSGGDVTPNLHAIQKKSFYGKMFSTDYGGGTANIEFEMLTGLTNYWLNTVPYTNLLSKRGKIETIASELKADGYSTVAIHPYNGGMYKRNIVLKNGGFDKFITETEMSFRESEGGSEYINDRSSYQEILKQLRDEPKSGPKLIFNITMQNHVPFWNMYDNYDFILTDDYTGTRKEEIEAYFQSLHESDRYLGELIEEIEKMNEKTVVLFFGDHSAGVFDELVASDDLEDVKAVHYTPYFIYTNFKIEDSGFELGETLRTVSPNCLVSEMRRAVNIFKISALNRLTDAVCEETPVLSSLWFDYEEVDRTELLKKYELVTYDLTAGRRFWE